MGYGGDLAIVPLQGGATLQWQAHEASVLNLDWSPVTGLVISGGEDGRAKVGMGFVPSCLLPCFCFGHFFLYRRFSILSVFSPNFCLMLAMG